DLHVHRHQEVAVAVLLWRSLAADAERLAGRRAGRDLQRHRAVQRRNLHVRAERGLRVAHRKVEREVGVTPPEHLVRLDAHPHEQVARRGARAARLAAPPDADALPLLHPGRDLHGELPRPVLDAGAAARVTRMLDDPSRAAAPGTGLCELEHPLVHRDLTGTTALRTRDRLRAGLRARSAARLARRHAADLHRYGGPVHRILERDPHLGLEVGAALRLRPPSAATAAPAPEQPPEQVAQVAEVLDVEALDPHALPAGTGETAAREPTAEARPGHLPDLVVALALLVVAEHVVRRRDLLEPLLRVLVPAVAVRVELLRELAVGLLDLRGGRVLRHAEDLVVVLLEPLATNVAVHRGPTS